MSRRIGNEEGQAAIELVAAGPLLMVTGLVVVQLLAAGWCRELASAAARAGAIAELQSTDAAAAARRALPGWARGRATIRIEGRRVDVQVAPPSLAPGLSGVLTAHESADAGPPA